MSDHKFYEAMQERAKSQLQRYVNGNIAVSGEDALMMLLIGELNDIKLAFNDIYDCLDGIYNNLRAIREEYCGD